MREVVKTFIYENNSLRIVKSNWFLLDDVCNILRLNNSREIFKKLDAEEKIVQNLPVFNKKKSIFLINESGLYNLLFTVNSERSKVFRRWLIKNVLPSIRKYGKYLSEQNIREVITNSDSIISLANNITGDKSE